MQRRLIISPMYHKKHKYDLIIIFAVIALSVSLFLAISSSLGLAIPCDLTQGCEVVLNSKYAKFLGMPLSYWGVAYFGLIIISSLLANHYHFFRKTLTWFLGMGALASLSFLSLQFFVIKSICQYCLLVDTLTIAMFLWDLNVEHHRT